MRAITYTRPGEPSVLEVAERPIPEPVEGEVRIRVLVSGVNPTDWKSRSGAFGGASGEPVVPNHDGAGIVDEVGAGVEQFGVGDRVWVTLAGDGRPASGTAQEYTVVPAERVFPLPDGADFDLGASVGIPAVTARRALTVAEDGPARLHSGALSGRVVLIAGWGRCGRKRGDPARALGRRKRHRHCQQRRQGEARRSGRRSPRRQLRRGRPRRPHP
jgi:NADPH2:quinone reductase